MHWRSMAGLSCGSGACTRAASVSMLMPQAMEKNEAMEGMGLMRREVSRGQYKTSRIPQGLRRSITELAGSKKKDAPQPRDALQNFHQKSYPADADVGKSLTGAGNLSKGTVGKVNDATAVVRATVIHAHHNAPAVALVSHANLCAEGERWMGRGELRRGEALSVGSETACKAIIEAVVAGSTAR